MRFPLIATTAFVLLPLAACDRGPTVNATNATPAEVQEKVAAATGNDSVMVRPGRWEGTMTLEQLDVTNIPAQARDQMKQQMEQQLGSGKSFVNCVTEEDVKTQKAFFTGADDKSCRYDHFTMTGGKIDAAMTCDHPDGAKMAMTMNGSYSADHYSMKMSSRTEGGASPMGPMSMAMNIQAKRVGDCKGSQDEQ